MLENLIDKYKQNDVNEVVYRLSYAGCFVIVKGKTLSGSLYFIKKGFDHFKPDAEPTDSFNALYHHFYSWYWHCVQVNKRSRFTIKIIKKSGRKIGHYELLEAEQQQIDQHRYNPSNLGNTTEAYIPVWRESTQSYGWLEKTAVMSFKRYLTSQERKNYLKKHGKKKV